MTLPLDTGSQEQKTELIKNDIEEMIRMIRAHNATSVDLVFSRL